MKLKFKNQDFQTDAVNAVVELFIGQEKTNSTFSVDIEKQQNIMNDFGIGNALLIDDKDMLANMHEIQKRNNLPKTDKLEEKRFCVEMETGTGKTYVYTKTIFELNKRYGFTKFIVVVPSVAIREGVYKSLEITGEHFAVQYDNVPCRFFIYNSAKLSDVRQFATSSNIEIMIINIDAFKKAENIINQAQDKLNGETAMRYIQDTSPIVIIDEPQSVDNTPKAKEAISSLKPLCVLRYSATHKEKINLLYRLTPVDAYQMGLVKQICVSSNQVSGGFNKPYIRLLSVSGDNGFKAKIEFDVKDMDGKVTRKPLIVKPDADLFLLSGKRDIYEGYTVAGIDCTPGYESIEFTNTEYLRLGKAIGNIDENIVKRAQIRRTIEAHLEKEIRYYDKGIKILSLFFIDEVKKYRREDGSKGIYAQMFEECYAELLSLPKFVELRDRFSPDIAAAHNGYFSQDKKGNYKNTKGDTLDDYDTYNTIMRDKEWLLSFDCPLRFIFSHSALKEGWDNPNVFQVCTLIEQKSTFTCRQKVGRGLRLCVNQDGERIEDKNINVLHVMANESFAEFADTLQKEIENETGVKFGVLEISLFSGMVYTDTKTIEKAVTAEQAVKVVEVLKESGYIREDGKISETVKPTDISLPKELEPVRGVVANFIEASQVVDKEQLTGIIYTEEVTEEKTITYDDAKELITHFEQKGYINKSGKINDTMKNALLGGTLDMPKKFESAREHFESIINRADKKPPLRDASRDVVVQLKKQVILSPEFTELWNKIKQKTVYRVKVDNLELVLRCVKEMQDMPPIQKTRLISQTAEIHVEKPGVSYTERELRTTDIKNDYSTLPNILTIIGEQALIKRSTVCDILSQSGRIGDFINNPQLFIEQVTEIIKNNRHELAIDGISYKKLDGEEYYVQEIFDSSELIANLDRNAIAVKNSVYDYIIYDSNTIEKPFAVALDNDPDVKMFFKIPDKFKIETPIGTYNPDWAVYLDRNGVQKLYFVLETKGSVSFFDQRTREQLKIHCGKQHFKALDDDIELHVATSWIGFRKNI